MKKQIYWFMILGVFALASCGRGTPESLTISNVENACTIARERPHYIKAMQRTEKKWGAPVPVQMAMIYHESAFKSTARTPLRFELGVLPVGRHSTAYGYAQALDGTWQEYKSETRRHRSRRDNITDATDFIGWYMHKTERRNGVAKTDARNQYLAYHEGHRGYAKRSYQQKRWLINVAGQVEQRAKRYHTQLRQCDVA